MKCPYCGEDMTAGRILTVRDLNFVWMPNGKKLPAFPYFGAEKNGGKCLSNNQEGQHATLSLDICPNCNIGISSLQKQLQLGHYPI